MNTLLSALLAAGLAIQSAQAPDSVHLVVVATTDVHGRVFHWDYVRDGEAPFGLTRAATVVDSLRDLYPGRVIVVDAGDLIQGNPFATYFAEEQAVDPHPVVDALNAVGFDAATPGNHEFNWGLDVFARVIDAAAFPVVSANLYRLCGSESRDSPRQEPWSGTVRISPADCGFTPFSRTRGVFLRISRTQAPTSASRSSTVGWVERPAMTRLA
jgi:2',3'-cyclic-nucleotide 2'-phosphodiesterase (5'-nucleotidase family)